jgi:tripartite-type tricarboxylate transporter receptor subunit TctC
MTFGTSLSVIPHVRTGRLRALATTGAQRSPALPDLPTIAEAGVAGYEVGLWYGFVGPANMPADIVQRLSTEIAAVLALPDTREKLASQGLDTRSSTPDEFARLLAADIARWAKIVQKLGLQAD